MSNRYYGRDDDRDYDRYGYGRREVAGAPGGYGPSAYDRPDPRDAYDWSDREGGARREVGDYSGSRWGEERYDRYGDAGRYGSSDVDYYDRDRYGGYRSADRSRRGSGRHRSWWDRTSDEVSSWFGDEDAERRRRQDEMRSHHSFRGRGPKGYRRSDARILEDVNDRLTEDPRLDASDIEVTVLDGVVTLAGTVNDRWEKRRANDLAEDVSGVTDVFNQIRVGRTTEDRVTGTDVGSNQAAD